MRVPPQLAGVGLSIGLAQKSSGCLPLAAANLVGHPWWVTVSPWCASFSLNLVGLLSRSGGLSFTSLGLWCCRWGAVLFLGTFGCWVSTPCVFLAYVVWPGFMLGRWIFAIAWADAFVVFKSFFLNGSCLHVCVCVFFSLRVCA